MVEIFIIPLALFSLFRLLTRGKRFEFDWGFGQQYQRFFYLLFLISLPGAFWLAWLKLSTIAWWLLGASIGALLFNGLIAYFYESYLHIKHPNIATMTETQRLDLGMGATYIGPSNYTSLRYSLILTLGTSSLLLFLMGVGAAFLRFVE